MKISIKQILAPATWSAGIRNFYRSRQRSVKRFWKKHGATVLKAGALVVFSAVIIGGAHLNNNSDGPSTAANIAPFQARYGSTSVDEIAGAEVAAQIAQASNLVIANSVTNLSDSLAVQVQLTGTDTDPYLENPGQVATDSKTREDIFTYTVQAGETISSIAKKFDVTSDTIRWENDLIGDAVAAGKKLTILPISGLAYKVKRGDSADALAEKYKSSSSAIISFNDAEVDGLPVGETIIIPNGKKPATVAYYNYPTGYKLTYGGNGYTYGYCTWHVANRRSATGNPVPRGLGNAVTWYARAAAGGLPVGNVPKAGAVVWHKNSYAIAGGDGHVAFVEKVNADGSAWFSEMNFPSGYAAMDVNSGPAGGWNRVSYRLIPPSEFSSYLFIY